jgi:hypothetical protein
LLLQSILRRHNADQRLSSSGAVILIVVDRSHKLRTSSDKQIRPLCALETVGNIDTSEVELQETKKLHRARQIGHALALQSRRSNV